MRKVLISPGYGAGWTTWEGNKEIRKFMFEYPPIIEFLENGGKFSGQDCDSSRNGKLHPILKKFSEECLDKFGNAPYLGGACRLVVKTVYGPIKIAEYDGAESLDYGDEEYL